MVFILEKRASLVLYPGSWTKKTLEVIARLAHEDARVAIQTLKNAGYAAEKEGSEAIEEKHIKEAYSKAKDIKKTYLRNKLSEHHRMLYAIVKERK